MEKNNFKNSILLVSICLFLFISFVSCVSVDNSSVGNAGVRKDYPLSALRNDMRASVGGGKTCADVASSMIAAGHNAGRVVSTAIELGGDVRDVVIAAIWSGGNAEEVKNGAILAGGDLDVASKAAKDASRQLKSHKPSPRDMEGFGSMR